MTSNIWFHINPKLFFGFWIRFRGGRGFSVVYSTNPPMFSERYGYRKVFRLWRFKYQTLMPYE